MKIAIITDTHCGVRNNSVYFMDQQEQFYKRVFWPVIDKLGIDTILHLGDYFDSVKSVSMLALHSNIRSFVNPAIERNMKVHMIPGNHDVALKHTNEVCSTEMILGHRPGFHVYNRPTLLGLDGLKVMMVPWITEDNQNISMNAISQDKHYDWCFGHFEVAGYKMYRNSGECRTGMTKKDFPDLSKVRSGHFHEPSEIYLGAPMEYTWSDARCDRGFSVLNTETNKISFARNMLTIFHEVIYSPDMDPSCIPTGTFRNKIVRLISGDVENKDHYDSVRARIEQDDPYELDIQAHHPVHLPLEFGSPGRDYEHETSVDLLKKRIDARAPNVTPNNKPYLDELMTELETICI